MTRAHGRIVFGVGVLALAVFLLGCTGKIEATNLNQEYGSGQVKLPDGFLVNVEIPKIPAGMELGLMGRTGLCESCGMLFIFNYDGRHGFWMKNMTMNIDIVFIDKDWEVVGIAQDAPPCPGDPCVVYYPDSDARYVLEIGANETMRHTVAIGSRIARTS